LNGGFATEAEPKVRIAMLETSLGQFTFAAVTLQRLPILLDNVSLKTARGAPLLASALLSRSRATPRNTQAGDEAETEAQRGDPAHFPRIPSIRTIPKCAATRSGHADAGSDRATASVRSSSNGASVPNCRTSFSSRPTKSGQSRWRLCPTKLRREPPSMLVGVAIPFKLPASSFANTGG